VILGGQSAGARGAMLHLDYVQDLINDASGSDASARTEVEVVGLLDSPLWMDLPPLPGSGFVGFNETCKDLYSYANVTHFGSECAQAFPDDEKWKCLMGQYRMPHVRTPYLLVASQYDSYQLSQNVGHRPHTPAERKYAEEFARRTAALVKALRNAWPSEAQRQNAVFSWACYTHATTCSDSGFDRGTCNGATVDQAMREFLGLAGAQVRLPQQAWIDHCQGFACGSGCSGACAAGARADGAARHEGHGLELGRHPTPGMLAEEVLV